MTSAEQYELLARANALEREGRHAEAIAACEPAIDGSEFAEINLTLARNHYALAARGNEVHAWPALWAALDGIARRCEHEPDVAHAVHICRWVLDHFSDYARLDAAGFARRHAERHPGRSWWDSPDPSPAPAEPVPADPTDPAEFERLLRFGQHVRLVNAVLAAMPSVVRHGRDPDSVAREARYLLATLLSSVAGGRVRDLLATDEFPPPGDHDGQLYDRYLLTASRARREHLRARAAGAPGIAISALPKSASAFLSHTLAEAVGSPVLRVTIGDPALGTVYAPWAAEVARGGAVTHDHFAATECNLAALREAGVPRVWVLVRDPRAVFWSYETMRAEYDGTPPSGRMEPARVLRSMAMLGSWIASWVRAEAAGVPVRFLFFRDLAADPPAVMGRVLDESGAGRFLPALGEVLRRAADRGRVSGNFRKGDDTAWRAGVPTELHGPIWDLLPGEVKALLALES